MYKNVSSTQEWLKCVLNLNLLKETNGYFMMTQLNNASKLMHKKSWARTAFYYTRNLVTLLLYNYSAVSVFIGESRYHMQKGTVN